MSFQMKKDMANFPTSIKFKIKKVVCKVVLFQNVIFLTIAEESAINKLSFKLSEINLSTFKKDLFFIFI